MHLRYVNKLGIPKDIELTGEPLSIGRSREADIPLLDDKVSRVHCGIRLSDGEFYLKDLKSRNGVFINGQRVDDTAKLKVGDRIQIGSTIFVLETATNQEDAQKALGNMQNEMDGGKGYTTILKEIVEDIAPAAAAAAPEEKPAPKPAAGRTPIKISHPSIKISANPKPEPAPEEKSGGGKIRISIKK